MQASCWTRPRVSHRHAHRSLGRIILRAGRLLHTPRLVPQQRTLQLPLNACGSIFDPAAGAAAVWAGGRVRTVGRTGRSRSASFSANSSLARSSLAEERAVGRPDCRVRHDRFRRAADENVQARLRRTVPISDSGRRATRTSTRSPVRVARWGFASPGDKNLPTIAPTADGIGRFRRRRGRPAGAKGTRPSPGCTGAAAPRTSRATHPVRRTRRRPRGEAADSIVSVGFSPKKIRAVFGRGVGPFRDHGAHPRSEGRAGTAHQLAPAAGESTRTSTHVGRRRAEWTFASPGDPNVQIVTPADRAVEVVVATRPEARERRGRTVEWCGCGRRRACRGRGGALGRGGARWPAAGRAGPPRGTLGPPPDALGHGRARTPADVANAADVANVERADVANATRRREHR